MAAVQVAAVGADEHEVGPAWCAMAELRDLAYLACGRETTKEMIRGARFSSVTPPTVTGHDGGASRRPWEVRRQHLPLVSGWLAATKKRRLP